MLQKTISIFFTVLFLGLISAPSIIVAIDDSIDISILYSLSEEEEETKNLEVIVSENYEVTKSIVYLLKLENSGFHFKNFPKPHLNLISPPPDFSI